MPQPTNGGFATQEEFRKWMMGKKDGKWQSEVHARPLSEQVQDYKDDSIADAFPLLFPYGFTGLPNDPAVVKLSKRKRKKQNLKRRRHNVFRKYLQHRKPTFHQPLFNLIVENLLMKEIIFDKTKMYCNLVQRRFNDGSQVRHHDSSPTGAGYPRCSEWTSSSTFDGGRKSISEIYSQCLRKSSTFQRSSHGSTPNPFFIYYEIWFTCHFSNNYTQ